MRARTTVPSLTTDPSSAELPVNDFGAYGSSGWKRTFILNAAIDGSGLEAVDCRDAAERPNMSGAVVGACKLQRRDRGRSVNTLRLRTWLL
jgi:hypothetical protein